MQATWNLICSPTGFLRDESGTSYYDYVLIASLVAVVGVIVLLALGKGM